jgi:hypothetical protein
MRYYAHAREPDDEPSPCVFTEEEYFDFFNRPYSVFNYTMLYLLREYHCLFVGMSMQDLNIRRLLHYSTSELRGPVKDRPTRTGLRHFAMLKRPDDPELERLTDTSLRRIGTRTLWIDEFEEIPAHLGVLYGDGWDAVYGLEQKGERPRQARPKQRSAAARRASSSNGAAR